MVIQHNLMALNSNRTLKKTTKAQVKSARKLASGYKINIAADDAAGLAISEKMRRQIRGLTQASLNAQDGISMVQTAEGAMSEIHDMLQRMNELCVKAENDTLTQQDRSYIQSEIHGLTGEINRVGRMTSFNEIRLLDGVPQEMIRTQAPDVSGIGGSLRQATVDTPAEYTVKLLKPNDVIALPDGENGKIYYKVEDVTDANRDNDGSSSNQAKATTDDRLYSLIAQAIATKNRLGNPDIKTNVSFVKDETEVRYSVTYAGPLVADLQVGAEPYQQIGLRINAVSAGALGILGVNVNDADGTGARAGIETIKSAIHTVSAERAKLGAVQNRLEHTIKNLDNVVENTTAAESGIRDTDMAEEMVEYSQRDILLQAGQAMLAQANQSNRNILSLFE